MIKKRFISDIVKEYKKKERKKERKKLKRQKVIFIEKNRF
jgi:hypothetical protein